MLEEERVRNHPNNINNKIIINTVQGTESCSWGSGFETLDG